MALAFPVPVATEVIEQNPACVTGGECRDGILVVYLDALRQEHWERLALPEETFIHWGPTDTLEISGALGTLWAHAVRGHDRRRLVRRSTGASALLGPALEGPVPQAQGLPGDDAGWGLPVDSRRDRLSQGRLAAGGPLPRAGQPSCPRPLA
jgi:hypothetical protein